MTTSNQNLPLVSIITPTYNQATWIRQTIESVKYQTYPNIEHIVIDGGSTDGTIDILKSYPHIKWSSSPDRGQADALNKGFAQATGTLIGWINSDDWYAKRAVELAVTHLQDYPIVMGGCQVVEEENDYAYNVANLERRWFDLLKYWIGYTIPTQPSMFFTRALLEEVRREDNEYVDPDLNYCMDYDLWVRMASRYPFIRRIPEIISFYRQTPVAKTAPNRPMISYAGSEFSLVLRRGEALAGAILSISYIIEASEPSPQLAQTVSSLLTSRIGDYEIIIVTQRASKTLRVWAEEQNAAQGAANRSSFIRVLSSGETDRFLNYNYALDRASGRILTVLPLGSIVSTDFGEKVEERFQYDRLGVLMPLLGNHQLKVELLTQEPDYPNQLDMNIGMLLAAPRLPFCFAIRRVAWMETLPLRARSDELSEVRRLLMLRLRYGWHLSFRADAIVTYPEPPAPADGSVIQRRSAELIVELSKLAAEEPMYQLRRGYGAILDFTPAVVSQCQAIVNAQ